MVSTPAPATGGSTSSAAKALGAGPSAPHRRRLLAEGGVGERLQRFVERGELAGDAEELLARVHPARERVHLVAQPIEPLQERVELAVGYFLPLHAFILGRAVPAVYARRARRRRACRARAGGRPARPRPRRSDAPRRG